MTEVQLISKNFKTGRAQIVVKETDATTGKKTSQTMLVDPKRNGMYSYPEKTGKRDEGGHFIIEYKEIDLSSLRPSSQTVRSEGFVPNKERTSMKTGTKSTGDGESKKGGRGGQGKNQGGGRKGRNS